MGNSPISGLPALANPSLTQTWFLVSDTTTMPLPTSCYTTLSQMKSLIFSQLGTGSPTSMNFLRGDGSWQAISAAAGGSTTQLQFNSSGALAGASGMTWNGTTLTANAVSVTTTLGVSGITTFSNNVQINGGQMEILSATTFAPQLIVANTHTGTDAGYVLYQKARGAAALQVGDNLGTVAWEGYDGAAYDVAASIAVTAAAVSGSAVAGNLSLTTAGIGTISIMAGGTGGLFFAASSGTVQANANFTVVGTSIFQSTGAFTGNVGIGTGSITTAGLLLAPTMSGASNVGIYNEPAFTLTGNSQAAVGSFFTTSALVTGSFTGLTFQNVLIGAPSGITGSKLGTSTQLYIASSASGFTTTQGINQAGAADVNYFAGPSTFNTGLTLNSTLTLPSNIKVSFVPGLTFAGINVGSVANDPGTLTNGDLWYNSGTGALNARIGGITVSVATGGGLTMPGTSNTLMLYDNGGAIGACTGTAWNNTADQLTFSACAINQPGGFSCRNLLVNGDMRIDQANGGSGVTVNASSTEFFSVDQWVGYGVTSAGVYTMTQASATPPTGFSSYLRVAVTTADASPAAGSIYAIQNKVEGVTCQGLSFGTGSAVGITVSFWMRSSINGTFGFSVGNGTGRSYPFHAAVSGANAWTYNTIIIPGDTSGTWLTTNGIGLIFSVDLGSVSTALGTAAAWTGSVKTGTTGETSIVGTNSSTFDITGVQVEIGGYSTPFERRDMATETHRCQRYFWNQIVSVSNGIFNTFGMVTGSTTVNFIMTWPTTMRASPTLGFAAAGNFEVNSGASLGTVTGLVQNSTNPQTGLFVATITGTSFTPGYAGILVQNTGVAYIQADARL